MDSPALAILLVVVLSPTAAASFQCKDKHMECPQWKRNMNGNCRGVDYEYMRHNCPETCDLCDEAREQYNKEEAERRKNPTYEPDDSKVVILDGETIDEYLDEMSEDHLVVVEFFAPWCGHCQQVAPQYREAARQLHALSEAGTLPVPVVLAKFDDQAPENRPYAAGQEGNWNFTSYPSMYIVGPEDGEFPLATKHKNWYKGGKESAENIVYHMTEVANGKNQRDAWFGWLDTEKRTKPGMYKKGGKHETDALVEIDDTTFVETVLRSEAVWIVEYYSDKCPICNTMAPAYIEGATKAQEDYPAAKLRFGAVNSRVFSEELAKPYGVSSYPWVTSFYRGENIGHMAGMGGWESFYNWGKKKADEHWKEGKGANKDAQLPPPILDQERFEDSDTQKKNLAQRVQRFYKKYAPEKLGDDPEAFGAGVVKKWAGREAKLMPALIEKYGPEPAAKDEL